MAILGLGLIAISICFFAYKTSRNGWRIYLGSIPLTRRIESGEREKQQDSPRAAVEQTKVLAEAVEETNNEGARTPKAQTQDSSRISSVPLFNLHEAEKEDLASNTQSLPQGKPNEAQSRTSPNPTNTTKHQNTSMLPPTRSSSNSLMPPPSVKASALRPLPKLGGSLAPPPSAASTLRGPQKNNQSGLGIPPSTSTLPPNKRPSRKVLLDPGHSPLDWAHLIKNPPNDTYLRGEGVPPQLIKVTPSQLKTQNGRKGADAWGTYQGKVYNLTPYLKFHPGGVGELMRGAGKAGEAERLFIEIHPWVNWDGMLSECLVGILVSEESIGAQDLEAMD